MRLLRDARAKAVAERLRPHLERKDYDAVLVDKILSITAHFVFLDRLSRIPSEPAPVVRDYGPVAFTKEIARALKATQKALAVLEGIDPRAHNVKAIVDMASSLREGVASLGPSVAHMEVATSGDRRRNSTADSAALEVWDALKNSGRTANGCPDGDFAQLLVEIFHFAGIEENGEDFAKQFAIR
jgi:hypothetical protein